jgi:hypothetical protein
METQVRFTKPALVLCTPQQIEAVCRLVGDLHQIEVFLPFMGSPDGWVEFTLQYANGGVIAGGIAPEGDVHT